MQYAILEQLKSPPAEFKDVILDHFRCFVRFKRLGGISLLAEWVTLFWDIGLGACCWRSPPAGRPRHRPVLVCTEYADAEHTSRRGRLQREHVVQTCEKWIRDVNEHESARAKRMSGHLDKIRRLLAEL